MEQPPNQLGETEPPEELPVRSAGTARLLREHVEYTVTKLPAADAEARDKIRADAYKDWTAGIGAFSGVNVLARPGQTAVNAGGKRRKK